MPRPPSAGGVSRATAYRYFPTHESLLVELADITPAVASVEALVADLGTDDVEERLLALLDALGSVTLAQETHWRRALWVYLDTWLRSQRGGGESSPAVREGRRMRWLDAVLEPLASELSVEQRRRLEAALALTLGIDSFVVMKDVCRLGDEEALAVLRWAALALLRAGLEEAASPSRRPERSVAVTSPAAQSRLAASACTQPLGTRPGRRGGPRGSV